VSATEEGVLKLETLRTRKCGPCRACCKVGYIDEWGYLENGDTYSFFRKDFTWCERAYEGGCMVYPEGPPRRPITCHRFRCAWLNGQFLGDRDRPDRVRMVITREYGPMGLAWVIRELDPWAAEQGKGLHLFAQLRLGNDPILVVTPGPTVRYFLPGVLDPQIQPKDPRAHRKESLAWQDGEHEHEMELQPRGVSLCRCGFVDMRKKEVESGDPDGHFRGAAAGDGGDTPGGEGLLGSS